MSAEQMKKYWNPENILVDDEEILVLRVLTGPEDYSYAIRLREAQVELELSLKTKDKKMLAQYCVDKFEQSMAESLRELNKDSINEGGAGGSWKNRK